MAMGKGWVTLGPSDGSGERLAWSLGRKDNQRSRQKRRHGNAGGRRAICFRRSPATARAGTPQNGRSASGNITSGRRATRRGIDVVFRLMAVSKQSKRRGRVGVNPYGRHRPGARVHQQCVDMAAGFGNEDRWKFRNAPTAPENEAESASPSASGPIPVNLVSLMTCAPSV